MTDRRHFLQLSAGAAAALLLGCSRRTALEGDEDGVFRAAMLLDAATSESARLGAQLGGEEAARTAELVQRRFELVISDDSRAADDLVREQRVSALIGGQEEARRRALARVAGQHNLALLTLRNDDALLPRTCDARLYHVAPGIEMRFDALALHLAAQPRLRRWFLVVSEGEQGSALLDYARRSLARAGGSIAGYGSGEDAMRPARKASYDVLCVLLHGEERERFLRRFGELGVKSQLASAFAPPPGGYGVTCWHPELTRFGAAQLNERFRSRFGRPMDGDAWTHWMAVKILADSFLRGRGGDGRPLGRMRFDGHKGVPLSFRAWDQQLRQPLYVVRAGAKPEQPELLAEMPDAARGGQGSYLDQLHPPLDAAAVCGAEGEMRAARGSS